jgi:tRNA-2-methylthio-N6-dimethylallyladenosine synthase
MNTAESAAMELVFTGRGWTRADTADAADLVLLNTCAVRATAEERVFGRLALYEAEKKHKKRRFTLAVAGCMASRLGDTIKEKFPAVDLVIGTGDRSSLPELLRRIETDAHLYGDSEQRILPAEKVASDPAGGGAFTFSPLHYEGGGAFKSFVPIMHGCNNFCSYCIVPYVRGREVSRSPEGVAEELRLLAERGVMEATLLGQNVNSYHYEGGQGVMDCPALLELAARTVEGTPIRRLRFLSSHPKDLEDRAIEVMARNLVYCRHLHLPVQHGSNRVLERMNRRYTRERYLDLVRRLHVAMPGMSLSTDILVGFPGETDDDVEATLDLMREVGFLYAFMYHYNPREGTAAWNFPDRIPDEVKTERLSRVIELQAGITRRLLEARVGSTETLLIEGISKKNADELLGRTERDETAVVPGPPSLVGRWADVRLTGLSGNTLRAVLV